MRKAVARMTVKVIWRMMGFYRKYAISEGSSANRGNRDEEEDAVIAEIRKRRRALKDRLRALMAESSNVQREEASYCVAFENYVCGCRALRLMCPRRAAAATTVEKTRKREAVATRGSPLVPIPLLPISHR